MLKENRLRVVPLLLLLSLLLAGCAGGGAAGEVHHKSETFDGVNSRTEKENVALLEERLRPSSENLFRYLYAEEELLADLTPARDLLWWGNEFYWQTPAILGHYPVDNVRRVEKEEGSHYYAVWMTEKGRALYVFFTPEGVAYGHPLWVAGKAKTYAAFSSLRPGDSIKKVKRIDSSAALYEESFLKAEEFESPEAGNGRVRENYGLYGYWNLTSVHLLRDGFLEIRYLFDEKGGYVIDRIEYSPDFKGICPMVDQKIYEYEYEGMTDEEKEENRKEEEHWKAQYDFSILEKDYFPFETDEPVADAERDLAIPAEKADWILSVTVGEGEEAKETLFRPADFGENEIWTSVAQRQHGNDPEGSWETVAASGVPLTVLAEKVGASDWKVARILLPDGSRETVTREKAKKEVVLVAWLKNRNWLIDGSETGLALAGRGSAPYLPSITGVVFLP